MMVQSIMLRQIIIFVTATIVLDDPFVALTVNCQFAIKIKKLTESLEKETEVQMLAHKFKHKIVEGTNAKLPSRVVGGEDGDIGEFPYTVSIRRRNRVLCGGTIISDRHVLTAAHCINGVSTSPWKDVTVVTGTNSVAPGAGTSHVIKKVTIYPEYSSSVNGSWRNDIAVIALEKGIVFDMFTKPTRLPDQDTPENWSCVASGWGDMSFPKGTEPNNIRKATMKTIGNDNCQGSYKVKIFETHLCAFASVGVGLCTGDSGGPLIHNDTIVGIASFVIPCAKGIPDVFTRVFSYVDFIRKAIATT